MTSGGATTGSRSSERRAPKPKRGACVNVCGWRGPQASPRRAREASLMRLYNLLLRCYPASFRNEYGEEMRALFERRRRQTSGAGVARLWLATVGEVIGNA